MAVCRGIGAVHYFDRGFYGDIKFRHRLRQEDIYVVSDVVIVPSFLHWSILDGVSCDFRPHTRDCDASRLGLCIRELVALGSESTELLGARMVADDGREWLSSFTLLPYSCLLMAVLH